MASFEETATRPIDPPLTQKSAALPYLAAFSDDESADTFFVEYLSVDAATKQLKGTLYTRKAFMKLALRGASALASRVAPRSRVVHYFTANRLEDVVFRLAAVLADAVPVTVNWQADGLDRALYKCRVSEAQLVLTDAGVAQDFRDAAPCPVVDAAATLADEAPLAPEDLRTGATASDERIIIFTSGTTGNPKGVALAYSSYDCNRATFEQFLDCEDPEIGLDAVCANPLHHTNSTAITDWCVRRPRATVRLLERYTTQYWTVVVAAAAGAPADAFSKLSEADAAAAVRSRAARLEEEPQRVVCPLVARHVDFLDDLCRKKQLPVAPAVFKSCVATCGVILLLGSAPVGPSTVDRLKRHAGCLPTVRFGSTETCLQVCGTPRSIDVTPFEAGWHHTWNGDPQVGYYVGRAHPPHTEVMVVRSVDAKSPDYLKRCAAGEPGRVVTRGANVMKGYVANDAATKAALDADGWYLNLGDVGFFLEDDGGAQNLYWLSRDSMMLIRGGANYAYEQVNGELAKFVAREYFGGDADACEVAVVGLRVDSEHEDACCVTLDLKTDAAKARRADIEATFLQKASSAVSKGAKPTHVRFDALPKNFKGIVLVKELVVQWKAALGLPG